MGRPVRACESEIVGSDPLVAKTYQERVYFARLVPLEDGRTHLPLRCPLVTIGRCPRRCDVVLDFGDISRLHCIITAERGGVFVEDLESTNGTWLDGKRVRRSALINGATIHLGHQGFRIEFAFSNQSDSEAQDHHGCADVSRAKYRRVSALATHYVSYRNKSGIEKRSHHTWTVVGLAFLAVGTLTILAVLCDRIRDYLDQF